MRYRCPLCGEDFAASGRGLHRCPACGGVVEIPGAPHPGTALDSEREGRWAEAFFAVVKGALGAPLEFFAQVAVGRGWLRPFLMALCIYALVFLVSAAYQLGFQVIADPFVFAPSLAAVPFSAGLAAVSALAFVPASAAAALLLQAALYHICLMIVGAAKSGFESTFRVVCYSTVPQLLQIVPLVGTAVAFSWQLALAVIGMKSAHATSYGRAALAVFLPMIICCGLFMLAGAAAAGWLFAALISRAG